MRATVLEVYGTTKKGGSRVRKIRERMRLLITGTETQAVVIPTLRRLRQKDPKLEVAWATQEDPVSRQKQKKLTKPETNTK